MPSFTRHMPLSASSKARTHSKWPFSEAKASAEAPSWLRCRMSTFWENNVELSEMIDAVKI